MYVLKKKIFYSVEGVKKKLITARTNAPTRQKNFFNVLYVWRTSRVKMTVTGITSDHDSSDDEVDFTPTVDIASLPAVVQVCRLLDNISSG